MYDSKVLLNIADDINNIQDTDEVGKYYISYSKVLKEEQYNLTVMLLGMCVNKELTLLLQRALDVSDAEYPDELKNIYQDVLERYKKYNSLVVSGLEVRDDNHFFLIYLNDITERLLSGIKYIEKKVDESWNGHVDAVNEWNTRQRREERIRDRMKEVITADTELKKFTEQYGIELPYMYVLAWDLVNLVPIYEERKETVARNETAYYKLLPRNVRACLGVVCDNTLDILLTGIQTDWDKFEDDDPDAVFRSYKQISFRDLLPTIKEDDQMSDSSVSDLADGNSWIQGKKTHTVPYIKKEVLSMKPLIPMKIGRKKITIKLISMMVDVLKEEIKTKRLNQNLQEKNKELEQLSNEKADMMDYYAHSWKHISYPKIVKDVAEALLGRQDDDSVTMANKLLRAYNSEQTLKHGIQLLQYSISEDREKVRKEFKKGFFLINLPKEDGIVGIDSILYESLDMVILRLMMDDIDTSRRMKKCRSRIADIDQLREEYTEKFLKSNGQKENLPEWVNRNLFELHFDISDEWNAVRMDRESFAAAQMTEIFVELLTNILLHGNKKARLMLSADTDSMDIFECNDCENSKLRKEGKGIKTLEKVISKINFESNIENGIVCNKTDKEYSIRIRIDKKVIYRG